MRPEIKYLDIAADQKLTASIPPLAASLGIKDDRALKLTAMISVHGKSVRKSAKKLTASGYMAIARALLEADGAHNCGYASGLALIGDCTPSQAQQVIDDIEAYIEARKIEEKP